MEHSTHVKQFHEQQAALLTWYSLKWMLDAHACRNRRRLVIQTVSETEELAPIERAQPNCTCLL